MLKSDDTGQGFETGKSEKSEKWNKGVQLVVLLLPFLFFAHYLVVQTKKRPSLALCVISVFAKALIENESSEKCQRSQTQSGWKIENSISHGEWRRNTFAQMLVRKR